MQIGASSPVKEVVPELPDVLCRQPALELLMDNGLMRVDGSSQCWCKHESQRPMGRHAKHVHVADQEGPEVVRPRDRREVQQEEMSA
jgi:hypothetical protein